jgi:acetylornithine/LysW-gamma-L-lysine aminotransferase
MFERFIEVENRYLARVYSKRPIVLLKGRGPIVWDVEGKRYVDCAGGYGVCITGHGHPKIVDAVKRQAGKILICHGSFYNDVRAEFIEKLTEFLPSDLHKFLLCNSGSEAVESAIKLARKYTGRREIIAMKRAFHGKTLGALSATWRRRYKEGFEPLVPEFKHITFGDLEGAKEAITNKTAAVIIEPIQGEGGVHVAPPDFLPGLKDICADKGALLIFDEVQTGLGRTGKFLACQHWDVVPDVLCLAKGIAGGIPMGLIATTEVVMDSFRVGDHTSTLGGNPLACAVGSAVLNVISEEELPKQAAEVGRYFKDSLERLEDLRTVREVRGLGLMLGLELKFGCKEIIVNALNRGAILLDAGVNVLRFLPPLVIQREHVKEVVEILRELLTEKDVRTR